MARIPTYQKDANISDNDFILGSDGDNNELATKNFYLGAIAEFAIDKLIDPNATQSYIPVFRNTVNTQGADATRITNSIMTQDTYPTGTKISITGDLYVSNDGEINNDFVIGNDLSVGNDASITADLSVQGEIQGGTLDINGSGSIGTDLSVSNSLNVQGETTTRGLTVDNDATISGKLVMEDNINMTQNGRIINLEDPIDAQDAATKAYVDALDQGDVTGTGTTNTLPVWTDGPNGILSNSSISQVLDGGNNVKEINIATFSGQSSDFKINGAASKVSFGTTGNDIFLLSGDNTGFYANNFQMRGTLAVGRSQQATAATLDVGNSADARPAAFFRNGVIISNNPGGVQVDNTSMVIGSGDNDIVSGSDHCLAVGKNSQIIGNSDQSVAFGQGNTIQSNSTDAFAVGNSNTLTSSKRTQVLGFNNTVEADSSFIAGGGNQIASTAQNMFVLGYSNQIFSNAHKSSYIIGGSNQAFGSSVLEDSFGFGNDLNIMPSTMTLGYRNSNAGVPTPNKNLGLGETKFILGVGSFDTSNANALIITEGGINGGSGGSTPQIPRVILPTVPTFSASNDAAADAIGVPTGGLYQNNGVIQVNRGGGSNTDPLAGGGGGGVTQTTGTYTPQLIASVPSEWVISSYNIQQGKWVRMGNMVFCDFWIIINASNISGNTGGTSGLTVQGWPYDHDGGASSFQGGALNQCDGFDVQSTGSTVTLNSGLGNAKLNILKQNAAITNYFITQNMQTGDLNNGNQIYITGSFSYLTTDAATLNSGATIDS